MNDRTSRRGFVQRAPPEKMADRADATYIPRPDWHFLFLPPFRLSDRDRDLVVSCLLSLPANPD